MENPVQAISVSYPHSADADRKTRESLLDVPDLASSSFAEEDDTKRQQQQQQHIQQQQPKELFVTTSNLSISSESEDEEGESCRAGPLSPSSEGSACGLLLLSGDLEEESWEDENHKPRQSLSRIPSSIVLLDHDNLKDEVDSSHTAGTEDETACTQSIQERLKLAETLIKSYRNTIHSNEHLVDSLHKTLLETQEHAQNLAASRNELLQTVEMLYEERDSEDLERVAEPKVYLKMVMGASLFCYALGITSEYCVVAAGVVYLLEDFL